MDHKPDYSVRREGAVQIYRLERPAKRNAINRAMFAGLAQAAHEFVEDSDLRVMLIESEGDFFSGGFEISDLSPGAPTEGPTGFRRRYRATAQHDLYDFLESIEKPIVVAHQGPCFGAGLELSLSCDFRLAAPAAKYALPELNMGMIPGSGGTSRLVRTIGAHWARWLIMAAGVMDAEQARAVGLIHDIYPQDTFGEQVMAFCQRIATHPPEVMGSAKLAIELIRDLDRDQGRNAERLINSSLSDRLEQRELLRTLQERHGKKK